jgi:hypothetical protein
MRRAFGLVGLAVLMFVPLSRGGPIEGSSWSEQNISAGAVAEGGKVTEPGAAGTIKTFAAGRRACVVVVGDHDPVVDLEVKVYDSKGNLVAQDRGQDPARDYVAVMWYPPRQEQYRIMIHSYGAAYNKCSVAIK